MISIFDIATLPWERIAWSAFLILVAGAAGLAAHAIILRLLRRWTRSLDPELEQALIRTCYRPSRLILVFFAIGFVLPLLSIPEDFQLVTKRTHAILFIAAVSWLIVGAIRFLEAVINVRYDIRTRDNLKARAIHTQYRIFANIAIFLVVLVGVALILMSFDQIRQLGVSLLASAGIAGIILSFAAQKSIATVLAGIQIAITQPIRVADVVIVEGEWGWVEEITLTYVVVRIWDLRRLVVPITYFIEKPFQNWTKVSADLLGTVFLYMDYTIPVEEIRKELRRLLDASPLWDGKVCVVQVTNLTEKTVEIRALMSAADSSTLWDLRCYVREKLLEFVKKNYPEGLPRLRAELEK